MRAGADKTHRELFSEFYADLLREPLEGALADAPATPLSEALFSQMMRDILANSSHSSSMEQVWEWPQQRTRLLSSGCLHRTLHRQSQLGRLREHLEWLVLCGQ